MKRIWLLLLPVTLFVIAYLAKPKSSTPSQPVASHQTHSLSLKCANCVEEYIFEVIEKGSDIFHYPSGPMPAHTVSTQEAKKIAAYLTTLQGLEPSHPEWVQEGKVLFYGNCVGCHSNGGKGKPGYFPDLTRRPLLGLQKLRSKD